MKTFVPKPRAEVSVAVNPNSGVLSAARYYYYLPIAFLRIVIFVLRQRNLNLDDISVLGFLLSTPLLYILGFKGRLNTPFGRVIIRNRDKMRSIAYGAFKTHFSYLKEIRAVAPHKHFFGVVVDVGANVGDFTMAASRESGLVIAIEPGSENFTSLQSNIDANGIRNVMAMKMAAHNRSEVVTLDGMGSMLRVVRNGKGEVARGLPLDDVMDSLSAQSVDLLKLDVQGHEEKVLRGMKKWLTDRKVGILAVEVHPSRGVKPDAVTSLMSTYGYRLVMNDKYLFHQPHLYFVPNKGSGEAA